MQKQWSMQMLCLAAENNHHALKQCLCLLCQSNCSFNLAHSQDYQHLINISESTAGWHEYACAGLLLCNVCCLAAHLLEVTLPANKQGQMLSTTCQFINSQALLAGMGGGNGIRINTAAAAHVLSNLEVQC